MPRVVWTKAQNDFIRDNAGVMSDRDMAARLTIITGRSISLDALRGARHRLHIRKRQGRGICEVLPKTSQEPPC